MSDVKRFYREGLALSAAVHLGLLAVGYFGLPHLSRPEPDMPDIVPVSFVEISDVTRSNEPQSEPEPQPDPEPEDLYARDEPQQIDMAELDVPLPEDKPAPPEKKPDPAPEAKPEPVKPRLTVAPRTKPRPPSRFDSSKVAALIDRSIKEERPQSVPDPVEKTEEKDTETPQPSAFADRIATATLQAAIRQRVQECWYLPSGGKDVANMRVRIRIQLRQDGKLLRPPQFIDAGDLSKPGNEFYRIFAESARRAVQKCEPYDSLPLAQYDKWREIDFTFDAADMLGG
ncbi:hypothetical protein JCM17844_27530 [Iodidimonas gelatinilytica]|uniref:Cell envelope biogenesis protein TolA n=1 Tax=Iodidimonas gelatinilytica TaxID=1236966 RepID=A0A5A7MTH0_9PROT|nr:hypothetical protein [Iodidimonas gelatinilytica]GEQ99116.1 hypothetical protein JCM17844_27530 [Iodidimonas gelatinilytica]